MAAFHYRFLLDDAIFTEQVGDLPHGLQTDGLRIDYFTTAEAHGYLDLVLLLEKLLDLFDLEVQIMFFGFGSELDLLGLDNGLLFLGFLMFKVQ